MTPKGFNYPQKGRRNRCLHRLACIATSVLVLGTRVSFVPNARRSRNRQISSSRHICGRKGDDEEKKVLIPAIHVIFPVVDQCSETGHIPTASAFSGSECISTGAILCQPKLKHVIVVHDSWITTDSGGALKHKENFSRAQLNG